MKLIIRLKLMPRFIPRGLDGYKRNRACRTPVRNRTNDDEWLNVWDKEIEIPDVLRSISATNEEVGRLRGAANFSIKSAADYGDVLIGNIRIQGSMDYHMDCYVNVRKLKP